MNKSLISGVIMTGLLHSTAAQAEQTLQSVQQDLEQLQREVARLQQKETSTSSFNPDVSLILSATFGSIKNDPEDYTIPGISLAEETEPGQQGLALAESELIISANIDDKFFGRFTSAITPENEVEVEEAYIQTLGLPFGITLQAGRFYSELGYLNNQHPHAWDFVDTALPYRALLGNQYGDDGVQLRWLAPTDVYFEVGAELFRGEAYPLAGAAHEGTGSHSVFLTLGGDVGDSHSWQAGVSYLSGKAQGRLTDEDDTVFTGDVSLAVFDLVWKWAPQGNRTRTNLVIQAEYLQREEDGIYTLTTPAATGSVDTKQSGWYVQTVYQFMPRWRIGLRHDVLDIDDPGSVFAGTVLDPSGHKPERNSVMLDYAHSEFSRIRVQYTDDDSGPEPDHQLFVQYVMSLGAHGAHQF